MDTDKSFESTLPAIPTPVRTSRAQPPSILVHSQSKDLEDGLDDLEVREALSSLAYLDGLDSERAGVEELSDDEMEGSEEEEPEETEEPEQEVLGDGGILRVDDPNAKKMQPKAGQLHLSKAAVDSRMRRIFTLTLNGKLKCRRPSWMIGRVGQNP